MSFAALQDHALSRSLALPANAKELRIELRRALLAASDNGDLRTGPSEIHRLLEVLPEPPPAVAAQLRSRGIRGNAYCIVGGDKNQERSRRLRHFERDDGAWFDFTITVREHPGHLELLAYDFEIRFPPGTGTPFLRFDLNLPAHRNEDREVRAHLHPGSDDVLVPALMMSPQEVLALFLRQLRRPAGREKSRAPTAFELDWFRATHQAISERPQL